MVGLQEYVENCNKDGWEIDLLPVSESKKSDRSDGSRCDPLYSCAFGHPCLAGTAVPIAAEALRSVRVMFAGA